MALLSKKAPAAPVMDTVPEGTLVTLFGFLIEALPHLQTSGHIAAHDLKERIQAYLDANKPK